ncbi:MAG: T9SS type A sorting domain-containing protein [candidate division WOR-3 bacterium]
MFLCLGFLLAADTILVISPRTLVYDAPTNEALLNGEREIIAIDKTKSGQELYVGFEAKIGSGNDGDGAKLFHSTDRGQTWIDMTGIGWASQTKRHCSLSMDGRGRAYMTWNLFSSTFASVIYVTRNHDDTSVEIADRSSDFSPSVNRFYPTVAVSMSGETIYNAWIDTDPNYPNWVYVDYSFAPPYQPPGNWSNFNTTGIHDFDVVAGNSRRPVMRMDSQGYIYLQYINNSNARIYLLRPQTPYPTEVTNWLTGMRAVTPVGYTTEIASTTSGSHTSMEILGSGASTRMYFAWASTDSVIWFRKSTDGGNTFVSDPVRVSDPGRKGIWPQLDFSPSGDTVMIVWRGWGPLGGLAEIYFDYSHDGGTTWHTDTPITGTPEEDDAMPHIAVIDSCAYIVYNNNSWRSDIWMIRVCLDTLKPTYERVDEGKPKEGFVVTGQKGFLAVMGNLHGPLEIRIYDICGNLVAQESLDFLAGQRRFWLDTGVYFVRINGKSERAVVY